MVWLYGFHKCWFADLGCGLVGVAILVDEDAWLVALLVVFGFMWCCALVIAGLCIVVACLFGRFEVVVPGLLSLALLYSLRRVSVFCSIDVLFCCGWLCYV